MIHRQWPFHANPDSGHENPGWKILSGFEDLDNFLGGNPHRFWEYDEMH